jgi:hypothetical protein
MSLAVGRTEEARQFATDMMVLNEKYSRGVPEKANGDVVHNGNLVLGIIALDEGRIEEAKWRLLAAGRSTGSPVLGSFGPNMSLAKGLLAKGEPVRCQRGVEIPLALEGERFVEIIEVLGRGFRLSAGEAVPE